MFILPKTVEYTVLYFVVHIVVYILTGFQHKRILRTMYSAVLCAVYSVGKKKEKSVKIKPVPPGTFIVVNCFVSSTVHSKE